MVFVRFWEKRWTIKLVSVLYSESLKRERYEAPISFVGDILIWILPAIFDPRRACKVRRGFQKRSASQSESRFPRSRNIRIGASGPVSDHRNGHRLSADIFVIPSLPSALDQVARPHSSSFFCATAAFCPRSAGWSARSEKGGDSYPERLSYPKRN